jgi:hypothetical protein
MKRALVALVSAILAACVLAAPASAFYQRYVSGAYFPPGTSAASAWNGLTFNSVQWYGQNGTMPYMGTKYTRTDGTGTSWVWSNSGNIFDQRTIAYGKAWCGASLANQYTTLVSFCDTGNG